MMNGSVSSWAEVCRVTQGAPLNTVSFNVFSKDFWRVHKQLINYIYKWCYIRQCCKH